MLKNPRIKNKFIYYSLLMALSLYSMIGLVVNAESAEQVQSVLPQAPVAYAVKQVEPLASSSTITPQSIPEKNIYAIKHITKQGFKYKIIKFFAAMFGVIVSVLAIFAGLKIYQRFILKNREKFEETDYPNTLESPKDFRDAINLFLHKTNK